MHLSFTALHENRCRRYIRIQQEINPFNRSGFKTFNRFRGQGGREIQTIGILECFEDLDFVLNAEIGTEGRF
jgi:hypothetical protein